MAISIDKDIAYRVLLAAYREECALNDIDSQRIKSILNGSHKTYKYILITALLAKSTNEGANPLALQVGSSLLGAYDTRSLCHKVVVPFERSHLHKALGGSNEPFLNKPARFKELSLNNAVRSGKDKKTLTTIIEVLSNISTSSIARNYLVCALSYLEKSVHHLKSLDDHFIDYDPTLSDIYQFIEAYLSRGYEGQTLVSVVGALERLYYESEKEKYEVLVHKVNQSGASSNEVGDIDVYKQGALALAIEVKDKDFSFEDVQHSFDKMVAEGLNKGQFIYGNSSSFDNRHIHRAIEKYRDIGFYCYVEDVYTYCKFMLLRLELPDKHEFTKALIDVNNDMNVKKEVKVWLQETLLKLKWKRDNN